MAAKPEMLEVDWRRGEEVVYKELLNGGPFTGTCEVFPSYVASQGIPVSAGIRCWSEPVYCEVLAGPWRVGWLDLARCWRPGTLTPRCSRHTAA